MSGSSDNSAYIWNTTLQNSMIGRKPIATLQGHEAEVTCVEFSKVKFFGINPCIKRMFKLKKNNLAYSNYKSIIFV